MSMFSYQIALPCYIFRDFPPVKISIKKKIYNHSHYNIMNNIVVILVILEILSSLKMESYVRSPFVPPTYQFLVSSSTSLLVQIYKYIKLILMLYNKCLLLRSGKLLMLEKLYLPSNNTWSWFKPQVCFWTYVFLHFLTILHCL